MGSIIRQRRMKPRSSGWAGAASVPTSLKYLGRFLKRSQSTLSASPSQVTTRSVMPLGVYSNGAVNVSHCPDMSRRKGPFSLFTVTSTLAMTFPLALFSRTHSRVFPWTMTLMTR